MQMTKKQKAVIGVLIFLIVNIAITVFLKVDLSEGIAEEPHRIHSVFGFTIPFKGINITTILNTWLIMAFLVFVSIITTRRLNPVPGRLQLVFEMFLTGFDTLCKEVLGEKLGRKYMPLITTLFILIMLSNWIGVIPSFWHVVSGVFPKWLVFEEPTRDINTTLGFGIMCFLIAHISGIWFRGPKKYLAEFFQPPITIGKINLPNPAMGMLNIVGEFGKTISHSFRLFGNIFGGSIVILVIFKLGIEFFRLVFNIPIGFPIGLLVFLNLFLGLFIGLIQAFVFAMLALVYISLMVND